MATSELYKTTGRTEYVSDDPENPNQPKQPVKIIPRPAGTSEAPIVATPRPVFGGPTQIGSDIVPYPGGGGGGNLSPDGPNGNYMLLSDVLNGKYSGVHLPPGTVIIDNL